MRKTAFCICENKDAEISAFVFATQTVQSLYLLHPNFKSLAIFYGCTARFVFDLVGNSEDRFSHNEANYTTIQSIFFQMGMIFMLNTFLNFINVRRNQYSIFLCFCSINEPHHMKSCLWGFRLGTAQTGLYSHRKKPSLCSGFATLNSGVASSIQGFSGLSDKTLNLGPVSMNLAVGGT